MGNILHLKNRSPRIPSDHNPNAPLCPRIASVPRLDVVRVSYEDTSSTSFGSPIARAAAINLNQPHTRWVKAHASVLHAKSFASLGLDSRDADMIVEVSEMGLELCEL